MTLQPLTEHQSPGAQPTAKASGKDALYWLLALLPLTALMAFLVLLLMAASSAEATGGCGGG